MFSNCERCFLENACDKCPLTIDWASWREEEKSKKEKIASESEKQKRVLAEFKKNELPV